MKAIIEKPIRLRASRVESKNNKNASAALAKTILDDASGMGTLPFPF